MTTDHAPSPAPAGSAGARVDVPGDATLVPGVSGAAHDGAASRALVASLRAALPRAVRVRVEVGRAAAEPWSRPVADLGALGVDPAWVPWRFTGNDEVVAAPHAGVAATVALLALGAAGWTGPVEVRDGVPGAGHARTGREIATVVMERAC